LLAPSLVTYPVPLGEVMHGVEVFEAIVTSTETAKPVA
jgi:hypothetical protein